MKASDVTAEIQRALDAQGTNPFRAAVRANLPGTAIRHVLEGKQPRLGRLIEICAALGLELYVGPPREGRSPKTTPVFGDRVAGGPAAPAQLSVRDRELAEALAAIVEHWEALESDYARRDWLDWGTSSALRRVVAWLGWQVIDGGGRAADGKRSG